MYPWYNIVSYDPNGDYNRFSPLRTWQVMALTDLGPWHGLACREDQRSRSVVLKSQTRLRVPTGGTAKLSGNGENIKGPLFFLLVNIPSTLCLGGHLSGGIAYSRWHQRAVPTRLPNVLCAAPAVHGVTTLRDTIAPHLNQKGESFGLCVMEKTRKCIGKNTDSGVSEKLLPASALWQWIPVWL